MEFLTAAFVTGTLLVSFEGEGAGLALMAAAITIVGYRSGGPGGIAETVKGMGFFGPLIFSPCVVALSWCAMRRWLPERLSKRATDMQRECGGKPRDSAEPSASDRDKQIGNVNSNNRPKC
jgi:hypothetical protein